MSTQTMVDVAPKFVYKMLREKEGRFLIPLYQRDYAWGRKEIYQLLSDLSQADGQTYYLGTLVVMQRGERLEVVDGQQRLTTLTLLYKYLGLLEKNPLSFENRPTAMRALVQVFDNKDIKEKNFRDALENIDTYIKSSPDTGGAIKGCLQGKLMLFQVTLPVYTDVAAYFEVMNNRGRQLEAHEILKAKLMSQIKEVCPNLNKSRQESILQGYFSPLPLFNCASLPTLYKVLLYTYLPIYTYLSILLLIKQLFRAVPKEYFAKRWENCKGEDSEAPGEILTNRLVERYGEYVSESPAEEEGRALLTFPRLLLIALRCHFNDQEGEISLNDRNLLKTFRDNKVEPMAFIETLEKVREDFDSHVIRSGVTKDTDGVRWSLKSVGYKKEDKKEKEVPVLKDTYKEDVVGKRIIQLQSLLQVSGISWIPEFLFKRSQEKEKKKNNNKSPDDIAILEEFIRGKLRSTLDPHLGVLQQYLASPEQEEGRKIPPDILNYDSRPLLALNVLDYLFWKEGNPKDKDFVFRYRNSIEHFYPQDDTKWESEEWKDEKGKKLIGDEKRLFLNCIGNLYLTTGNENSELSNNPPSLKVDKWRKIHSAETPKQRRMYDVVDGKEEGKKCWAVEDCLKHALECWKLLADFLNKSTDSPSSPAASKDEPNTSSAGENGNAGE